MNKFYYLVLFLASLSLPSMGQEATVKGTVTDSKTKETLIGVNVTYGANQGVATDAFGNYLIKLPAGKHTLRLKYVGYGETTRDFTIKPGGGNTHP